jgi:hypothetical protein
MGNSKSKALWEAEANRVGASAPAPTSSMEKKEEWIRNKYLLKMYHVPRRGFLNVRGAKHSEGKYWCVLRSKVELYKDESVWSGRVVAIGLAFAVCLSRGDDRASAAAAAAAQESDILEAVESVPFTVVYPRKNKDNHFSLLVSGREIIFKARTSTPYLRITSSVSLLLLTGPSGFCAGGEPRRSKGVDRRVQDCQLAQSLRRSDGRSARLDRGAEHQRAARTAT